MRRIYLDNNATTPIHPDVAESIRPFLNGLFGNPSSTHFAGRDVKGPYDAARAAIAAMIGATTDALVITSCGSEANNHAIKGIAYAARSKGHIITSTVEHPAVLNVCRYLETQGFPVTYLPVDGLGSSTRTMSGMPSGRTPSWFPSCTPTMRRAR